MRRTVIAFLLLLASICAGAQKPEQKQLDSLKYILPEFSQGTVVFADKQVNHGVLNISPLDQAVYCLSTEKDTLYVEGNFDIISVSAAGKYFTRWKESFVELVTKDGNTGIGVIRNTQKVNHVQTGAYGMSSTTSSIRSYSVDANTGNLRNLIIDDPRNFMYTKTPCLYNNGKFMSVSKKSFEKLFPAQKDFIESVWAERNINVGNFDEVMAFYNELKQK